MCATGECRCCLLKGFSTQNHFTVLLESTECQRSLHFSAHHFDFGAFSCPVTFILTLLAPEVKCDDRKPLNKLKYQQWTFGFGVGSLNPKNKLPQVAHFAAFARQSFFYFQWIFKQKYTQEDFLSSPKNCFHREVGLKCLQSGSSTTHTAHSWQWATGERAPALDDI